MGVSIAMPPRTKPAKRRPSASSARKPSSGKRVGVPVVDAMPFVPSELELAPDTVKLTGKQRLFIEQYFICGLNATEAALLVYDCKDRNVARRVGAENLSKPSIRTRIDERLSHFQMTADEVLARLAFHARGSMGEFIDPASGTIDTAHAADALALGLIKRYRTKSMINGKDDTETLETEIELYDAQNALQLIGKHLNLFTDKSINLHLTPEQLAAMNDDELAALASGKPLPPKAGA